MKKPMIQFDQSRDEERNAWIYKAKGKFVGSEICYEFLDDAREHVEQGVPNVIMELSGVTMLNSTGIGIIASLVNATKEQNGKVYLVGASEATQRPLSVTHMWKLLERYDSLEDLPASL